MWCYSVLNPCVTLCSYSNQETALCPFNHYKNTFKKNERKKAYGYLYRAWRLGSSPVSIVFVDHLMWRSCFLPRLATQTNHTNSGLTISLREGTLNLCDFWHVVSLKTGWRLRERAERTVRYDWLHSTSLCVFYFLKRKPYLQPFSPVRFCKCHPCTVYIRDDECVIFALASVLNEYFTLFFEVPMSVLA